MNSRQITDWVARLEAENHQLAIHGDHCHWCPFVGCDTCTHQGGR